MAYNKFKIDHIQNKLHLKVIKQDWLPAELSTFEEDTLLMLLLSETGKMFLGSEKARSEFIVAPVLQSLSRKNKNRFSIFSGYEFNIDKSQELNGFCDFILSSVTNSLKVEAPTFFVVETKKTDVDDNAIAQCSAEMYAAKIFNERANKPQKAIYGCVTSGFSWAFIKLEDNIIAIDTNYVPLTFKNPYQVLATLQWVLNQNI